MQSELGFLLLLTFIFPQGYLHTVRLVIWLVVGKPDCQHWPQGPFSLVTGSFEIAIGSLI